MGPSPPLAPQAFFSLTEIPDRTLHRRYNEWHQLDHRPENLRLPGVAWGERWVRSPDCMAGSTAPADGGLTNLHYLNMYWFRDPIQQRSEERRVGKERR